MVEVVPHTRTIVKRDVKCINGKHGAPCVPSSVLGTGLLLSVCLRVRVQEGLHSRSTDPTSRWRRSQVLLWLLVSRRGTRCRMWEEAHPSWAQRRKRKGPTGSCLYCRALLTGEMRPQTISSCHHPISTSSPHGAGVNRKGRIYGAGVKCPIPLKVKVGDFSCGLVAKTLSSQCRGHRFDSWSGNYIPHATTKTECR